MVGVPVINVGSNRDPSKEGGYRWWSEKTENVYTSVFAVVNYIQQNQSYRNLNNIKFASLYENMQLVGLTPGSQAQMSKSTAAYTTGNRLTLNVIKSCVDTATSKIGKNKPRPLFLTEDGDYSLKRRAKLQTQYIEGLFDETKTYTHGQRVFVDSCVFGTGCLKIYIEDDKIKCERVMIDEIMVDDTESLYGQPRQMHQRKHMSKDVLANLYPEYKDKIMVASGHLPNEAHLAVTLDLVLVVESWHLPSGPKAKDGRHTISIDNCTLVDEEWKKDYFPFSFLRWSNRLVGFFGAGLTEELLGIQLEINKTLRSIQSAMNLMAVPRVFVDVASNINTALINNAIGGIVKYQGQPPIFESPPIMSPEVYAYLENLYKKAYEITGISQMNAASKKEPGITSGVAIREVNDIASERFLVTGQRFEEFYMETARIMIDLSKDLYTDLKEQDKELMVKASDRKFIKKIKWSDVDINDDQFSMRMFPVSLLPSTPAGKLQMVQDLMQSGLIGKDEGMGLLDFPDVEKFFSLQTAAVDNIERMLENMLENGDYMSPEPFMNLQLALKMTQEAYLRARTEKVSDDKLDLLRTFMEDVQNLLSSPSDQSAPANPVDPTMAPLSPMASAQ